ncbi:Gfo/Idh/MocA family protein [Candidatus Hydrogenedentota bacterium]
MPVICNHDFTDRVRAGFIGCGGHSFRNIFPTFQYTPVELAAVCDVVKERAETYKEFFGASAAYSDHNEMLAKEKLDVVFIVTNYIPGGEPRYPELAAECLRAGAHVWIEKPPVGNLEDVRVLREAMAESGKKLAVGFKKMFTPANMRLKQIISSPQFGRISTISLRYPLRTASVEDLMRTSDDKGSPRRRVGFLDHLPHPVSILQLLGGRVESVYHTINQDYGGFVIFNMKSGATASLHCAFGQSGSSHLERTEVIGDMENAVVENGIRLTYYRRLKPQGPGRSGDFTGDIDDAPVVWEPQFSLGTIRNKTLFLVGYYNEIKYFCDAVLNDTKIEIGNIDDAEEGIQIFEAFKEGPNKLVTL